MTKPISMESANYRGILEAPKVMPRTKPLSPDIVDLKITKQKSPASKALRTIGSGFSKLFKMFLKNKN